METGYHHMTWEERLKLDALRRAGVSVADCAQQLGFCQQTIYNELKRGECDVVHEVNGYLRDMKSTRQIRDSKSMTVSALGISWVYLLS